jgi:broad specificity phosphatase PhoE
VSTAQILLAEPTPRLHTTPPAYVVPITTDPRLNERSAGPFEGLRRADLERAYPGMRTHAIYPRGFESLSVLISRTLAALSDIVAAHPGPDPALVITHSALLRNLMLHLGLELQQVDFLAGVALGPGLELLDLVDTQKAQATPT